MKTYIETSCFLAILFAICSLVPLTGRGEALDLILSPNSTTKVDVPAGVRKIYISNPTIIDAEPEDDGLAIVVSGLGSGEAELRIAQVTGVDLIYKVTVQPELQDMAEEVRRLLADVEGVNVKVLGDNIIVDGELFTRGGSKRVKEVTAAFNGVVVDITALDLTGYNRNVAKAIEREIGIDSVEVEVDGERIILNGTVPSQADLERVKEIVKKRGEKATIMLMVK